MDRSQKIQKRIIKAIGIFLGILMILTLLSNNIYEYLLPIIEVEKIKSGTVDVVNSLVGKISLNEELLQQGQVEVTAPITGQIVACNIQEGQEVKKGETLFKVKKYMLQSEIAENKNTTALLALERDNISAKIKSKEERIEEQKTYISKTKEKLNNVALEPDVVELKNEIESLRKQFLVDEKLYNEGLCAKETYEQEKTQLELLELKLENAQLSHREEINDKLYELENSLTNLQDELVALKLDYQLKYDNIEMHQNQTKEEMITSPVDGMIYALEISKGTSIQEGNIACIIVPTNIPYELGFEVNDTVSEKIQLGQQIEWTLNRQKKNAKVLSKSNHTESGNVKITCHLEEEDLKELNLDYKTSKNVQVKISQSSCQYDMIVPKSAIIEEGSSKYIYALEETDGLFDTTYSVSKINVMVLEEGDMYVAVEGPVSVGDKIVKSYSKILSDNCEVALQLGGN